MKKIAFTLVLAIALFGGNSYLLAGEHGGQEHGGTGMEDKEHGGKAMEGSHGMMDEQFVADLKEAAAIVKDKNPELAERLEKKAKEMGEHRA